MGKLAIQMSKKYDLKKSTEFDAAKAAIEKHYADRIANETVPPSFQIDTSNPALDQPQAGKTSLTYRSSNRIDHDLGLQIENSFRTHPQISGLVNAEIVVESEEIVITVDSSRLNKTTIGRVLDESVKPSVMRWNSSHQSMVNQRVAQLQSECMKELSDLAVLRDNG